MELFHVAVFCTSFVGGYLFHYVREKMRRKTIRDLVRNSFHPDGFTLEHSTNRIKHLVSEEVAREVTELFKQGVVKAPKIPEVQYSEKWRGREAVMPREVPIPQPEPKVTVSKGSHLVAVETKPVIVGTASSLGSDPAKRGKSMVKKW